MLSDRKTLIKALEVAHSNIDRLVNNEVQNEATLLLTIQEHQGKIEKLLKTADKEG